ncbi:hypothetical protein BDV06DRAFT_224078 [Aspergillus oleicola]
MVEFPVADFFTKGLSWRTGIVDPKAVAPELGELFASGRARLDFIVSSVINRRLGRTSQVAEGVPTRVHYPPRTGFVVDDEEVAIDGNVTLPVGQKLDRFGSEYGTFHAPLGAPYVERSLPPNNLITYDGAYPFNYHVYEVTKEFVVGLGPIAPWFERPGMGTQFVASTNVLGLVDGGYLRRLEDS